MDRQQEALLVLLSRTVRFATEHPYAATGIFGAMVGSAATYKVLTLNPLRQSGREFFTPKVYELALSHEDIRALLVDPAAELRWNLPNLSVVITAEKRERPKELPDIIIDPE